MHAVVVKTLPAFALSSASESFEIESAVVTKHVVLAGYVINLAGSGSPENLRRGVELFRRCQVRDVAGVNQKRRLILERIDLVDCLCKCLRDVMIWVLVKTDMAVADLDKAEAAISLRS